MIRKSHKKLATLPYPRLGWRQAHRRSTIRPCCGLHTSILQPYSRCSPSSKVPEMRVTSSHRPSTSRQSGSPTSGRAPNVVSRRDSAARADPAAAILGSAGFPLLLTGHRHHRRRPRRRPVLCHLCPFPPPVVPSIKRLHRDVRELPLGQTSVQALIRRPAASLRTRGCGFAACPSSHLPALRCPAIPLRYSQINARPTNLLSLAAAATRQRPTPTWDFVVGIQAPEQQRS
ncbi:hypothetical protein BDP81DRAFT_48338 [Colletotrichum phormii]|uniref:Uncharacterized protein n=1 Tax=Colletotrichum phormii TaxID=359342 RepID=A0AAJ0ECY2_9PEZI|nr:uncharacterized protein BDP81DRAFT_48338 [Colletotrichum phormii]KAK1635302.1 hypothetical protein BDP81DRAFT_48338 [Colletotrichum phormii]